jgi:hypothetical protein
MVQGLMFWLDWPIPATSAVCAKHLQERIGSQMSLKFSWIAGVVLAATLLGAQVSLASTSATQNVTFTVAKSVAIVSTGDKTISTAIDPSSGTPTGTTTSGLTVSSNDASGFNISAKTNAATVTEAGTCTPAQSASVGIMAISAGTPTGQSGGTSAGTAASAFALSTTTANLYSAAPNYTGGSMSVTTSYTVTPGWTTPANTSGCTYTIPVVLTVSAL